MTLCSFPADTGFCIFSQAQQQPISPAAPLTSYAAVSLSNVIATSCQYEALKHVTFPVQTLGKCAKMIPVMVWGTLISRKAYSSKDYTVALLVTTGCTVFLLGGKSESVVSKGSSMRGGALMLTYLAFDGFTSTFQVRCPSSYCPVCTLPNHSLVSDHWLTPSYGQKIANHKS